MKLMKCTNLKEKQLWCTSTMFVGQNSASLHDDTDNPPNITALSIPKKQRKDASSSEKMSTPCNHPFVSVATISPGIAMVSTKLQNRKKTFYHHFAKYLHNKTVVCLVKVMMTKEYL